MFSLSGLMNDTKASRFTRLGKMLWDTLDYHSDPVEAMEDAKKYDVKMLVICHLAPPATNVLQKIITQAYFRKRPTDWNGQMVFGSDGDHWSLPKASKDILKM